MLWWVVKDIMSGTIRAKFKDNMSSVSAAGRTYTTRQFPRRLETTGRSDFPNVVVGIIGLRECVYFKLLPVIRQYIVLILASADTLCEPDRRKREARESLR